MAHDPFYQRIPDICISDLSDNDKIVEISIVGQSKANVVRLANFLRNNGMVVEVKQDAEYDNYRLLITKSPIK